MNADSKSSNVPPLTVAVIGTIALAVAMGIGRFAFTPMVPLMARDGLLSTNAAAWLAASNYLGYFFGALTASRVRVRLSSLIGGSLLGIALATIGMGATHNLFAWGGLRFIAGVLSAFVLIGTSAWALQSLAKAGRQKLAGFIYAGVGIGIVAAGIFCLIVAQPGVHTDKMWIELGVVVAIVIAVPLFVLFNHPAQRSPQKVQPAANDASRKCTGLIICYGCFGFGYILPATFLPALAREVVDNPAIFGWAWPLFGLAAAVSTLIASWHLGHIDRRRVWAYSHLVLAVGTALPTFWLSRTTIAIAALFVGGTFMVITMVGIQEIRSRSPDNPTALLGKMTSAFAFGQFAGPIISAVLGYFPALHGAALNQALRLAALGLILSAGYLWRQSND